MAEIKNLKPKVSKIKITLEMEREIIKMLSVPNGRDLRTVAVRISGIYGSLPAHFSANDFGPETGKTARVTKKRLAYEEARGIQDRQFFDALMPWVKTSFGEFTRDSKTDEITGTSGGSKGSLYVTFRSPGRIKFSVQSMGSIDRMEVK